MKAKVALLGIVIGACLVDVGRAEQVTIQFMHWGASSSYVARNERLIAEFQRKNPNIKVERVDGGSSPQYEELLLTRIAGGTAPDVFMVDMQYIPLFAQAALDLRPYLRADADFDWSRFPAIARDVMTFDGRIVGTSESASPNIWYYNADMFEAAGLELPTQMWLRGGWTWADFRDVSRKLHRVDGQGNVLVWGNAAGTHQALNRLFMWSNGAPEFDDVRHPTRSFYDAPEAIAAIRFVQQMQVEDRIAYPYPGVPNTPFQNGQVAMMARWSSGITAFRNVPFRFGIAPYPKGPGPRARYASDFGTSLFMVWKDTPHPEAASAFARFLAGKAAAPLFAELGPGVSFYSDIRPRFFPKQFLFPETLISLLFLPDNGNQLRLMSRNAREINRIVDEGMGRIMKGEVAAAQGMTEIARQVNAYLREHPQ